MGAVGDGVAWVVVWVRSAWGWVALLAAVVRVCVCGARRQIPLFRVANTGTHGTYVDYARACCVVVEVVVCMCVHAAICPVHLWLCGMPYRGCVVLGQKLAGFYQWCARVPPVAHSCAWPPATEVHHCFLARRNYAYP